MLDSFLNVLYVHESRAQQEQEAIALLKQLPEGDLMKLASGVKVASLTAQCGPGGEGSFLDKFQGSPLFEEAVALEEQELQADMTSLEKRKEQRIQSQAESGLWDLHDELRIKKRLLELRLAQEEAGGPLGAEGAEDAAGLADPLAAAPVGAPPILDGGPPAPGAVGPEAVPAVGKTAGAADHVRKAYKAVSGKVKATAESAAKHIGEQATLHPRTTGAVGLGSLGAGLGALEGGLRKEKIKEEAEKHPKNKLYQFAAKHPKTYGALAGGGVNALTGAALGHFATRNLEGLAPGSIERGRAFVRRDQALRHAQKSVEQASKHAAVEPSTVVDTWGRELARTDFVKAAEARTLEEAATEAGRTMAKEALNMSGLAGAASSFIKNPKNLGTLVGGGLGAATGLASGLQKDEHGQRHILGGLAQGAAGGAAGALAGHATQNIGSAVRGGASVGDAAKQYGTSLLKKTGLGGAAGGAPANRGNVLALHRPSDPPSMGLGAPDVSQFSRRSGLLG